MRASGVDQALWDIKGRQAGMPVYQLAGGKCREAADTYAHASGAEFEEVVENARKYMAQGWRHVRVQVGLPGMSGYGSQRNENGRPKALHDKPLFDPAAQFRRALKLLEVCRRELGVGETGKCMALSGRPQRLRKSFGVTVNSSAGST